MEAVIENLKGTRPTRPVRGTKKSFNFEQDVERLFNRYKRQNPMIIESRVINQGLREWLIKKLAA